MSAHGWMLPKPLGNAQWQYRIKGVRVLSLRATRGKKADVNVDELPELLRFLTRRAVSLASPVKKHNDPLVFRSVFAERS
jgi:hypothetical protein